MKKCLVKWMSRDIFQISEPFPVRDLLLQDWPVGMDKACIFAPRPKQNKKYLFHMV